MADGANVVERGDPARRDDPATADVPRAPRSSSRSGPSRRPSRAIAVTSNVHDAGVGEHVERLARPGCPAPAWRQPSPRARPSRTSMAATMRSGPWRRRSTASERRVAQGRRADDHPRRAGRDRLGDRHPRCAARRRARRWPGRTTPRRSPRPSRVAAARRRGPRRGRRRAATSPASATKRDRHRDRIRRRRSSPARSRPARSRTTRPLAQVDRRDHVEGGREVVGAERPSTSLTRVSPVASVLACYYNSMARRPRGRRNRVRNPRRTDDWRSRTAQALFAAMLRLETPTRRRRSSATSARSARSARHGPALGGRPDARGGHALRGDLAADRRQHGDDHADHLVAASTAKAATG